MTAEEITILIAKLQAQIADLQKQLLSAQNAPVVWCHDFNLNLKYGDNSSEIEELKTALIKDGVMPYMAVDYDFDEETASYIVAFQEKYASEILTPWGLKHGTGFAGKSTRAKLNKLYGCGVAQSSIPAPFVSVSGVSEQVKCIFNGSISKQKCYSENNYSCSGIESCVVDVKGLKGEKMTWKSSCGGYADTIIDGQNKYAEFKCAPSITVLSPNGGETYLEGQVYKIKWNATKGVNRVMIGLQGPSSRTILASTSASTGFYSWTVPTDIVASSTYKILIGDIDSSVNDESDDYFSIMTTATPSITVLSPNGGEKWQNEQTYTVIWTSSNMPADAQNRITIGLILKGTENNLRNFISLVGSTVNDGSESITIPSSVYVPAGDYKLWVKYCPSSGGECSVKDSSDNYFSIAATTTPSITVLSPNGGETWTIGKTYNITWNSTGVSTVNILLYNQSGNQQATIVSNLTNDGADSWTIPSTIVPGQYKIYIYWESNVKDQKADDYSDNYFNIVKPTTPSITVLSPNGGERFVLGSQITVKWQNANYRDSVVNLNLYKSKKIPGNLDYNFVSRIGDLAQPNDETEMWTIPSTITPGDNYFIRANLDVQDPQMGLDTFDDSDAPFSIIASTTSCIDSDGGISYYTKGWAMDSHDTKSFDDYCTLNGVEVSSCTDVGQNCGVIEKYCDSNNRRAGNYIAEGVFDAQCPYGCSNGACLMPGGGGIHK